MAHQSFTSEPNECILPYLQQPTTLKLFTWDSKLQGINISWIIFNKDQGNLLYGSAKLLHSRSNTQRTDSGKACQNQDGHFTGEFTFLDNKPVQCTRAVCSLQVLIEFIQNNNKYSVPAAQINNTSHKNDKEKTIRKTRQITYDNALLWSTDRSDSRRLTMF